MSKNVSWANDVTDTIIKRPCECMCCNGCKTNKVCGVFGPHFCKKCEEWRCDKCMTKVESTLVCRSCMRDWSP